MIYINNSNLVFIILEKLVNNNMRGSIFPVCGEFTEEEIASIESLTLTEQDDLSELSKLTNLKSLTIIPSKCSIDDICENNYEEISFLKNLETLSIMNARNLKCLNVVNLKKNIVRCKNCGHITEKEICSICSNSYRNDNIICVVEDYKSVFMFEKSGNYDGMYHVLNGLISPIDGITPDELNISSLINRIDSNNDEKEIIIALKPSIEGEATTLYLKKILEEKNVKITRLSYGIPMGVEIDYLDSITLDRALKDRKDI